ncbi:MAG: hypothetical protein QOF21_1641 [Actinomycetota bacterium]|jgi:hypothetical protein
MATIAELRTDLGATTVPDDLAKVLIKGASPLWLSSDCAMQLAGDLALCHPALKRAEVRARAGAAGDEGWRLTVVAHDRKGLLADTATILSVRGYDLRGASVTTWAELDLALHAITVAGPTPNDETLDEIGTALRAANDGVAQALPFTPIGRAYVSRTGAANGDPMITVVAPGQLGLLATICRWFANSGASIEAAWITGEVEANDVFVVRGDVDLTGLERMLTAEDESLFAVIGNLVNEARDIGETIVRGIFRR